MAVQFLGSETINGYLFPADYNLACNVDFKDVGNQYTTLIRTKPISTKIKFSVDAEKATEIITGEDHQQLLTVASKPGCKVGEYCP